jgi:hypothetical protein
MSSGGSNTTAPTRFVQANSQRSAYRRFGNGPGRPRLCLQHFTGTLDNWDPAVTDPLPPEGKFFSSTNAGIGRSSGDVPETVAGMAEHAIAFLEAASVNKPIGRVPSRRTAPEMY